MRFIARTRYPFARGRQRRRARRARPPPSRCRGTRRGRRRPWVAGTRVAAAFAKIRGVGVRIEHEIHRQNSLSIRSRSATASSTARSSASVQVPRNSPRRRRPWVAGRRRRAGRRPCASGTARPCSSRCRAAWPPLGAAARVRGRGCARSIASWRTDYRPECDQVKTSHYDSPSEVASPDRGCAQSGDACTRRGSRFEAVSLRITDIDSQRMLLHVVQCKGRGDRSGAPPRSLAWCPFPVWSAAKLWVGGHAAWRCVAVERSSVNSRLKRELFRDERICSIPSAPDCDHVMPPCLSREAISKLGLISCSALIIYSHG